MGGWPMWQLYLFLLLHLSAASLKGHSIICLHLVGFIYLFMICIFDWTKILHPIPFLQQTSPFGEAGESMRSTKECGPSVAAFAWQWISLVILDPCSDQISSRWQIVKGMSCAVCKQAWHRVRGSCYAKTKQFYETGGDGASWLVFYHHKISL